MSTTNSLALVRGKKNTPIKDPLRWERYETWYNFAETFPLFPYHSTFYGVREGLSFQAGNSGSGYEMRGWEKVTNQQGDILAERDFSCLRSAGMPMSRSKWLNKKGLDLKNTYKKVPYGELNPYDPAPSGYKWMKALWSNEDKIDTSILFSSSRKPRGGNNRWYSKELERLNVSEDIFYDTEVFLVLVKINEH